MKLCKSPYPPLHCRNASKVGWGMKAGDTSALIGSEDGMSDLCSAPSKGKRSKDRGGDETGTSHWFKSQISHDPMYHL